MLLLIVLPPFAGFLINASFGRRIGKRWPATVACGAMFVSFLISCLAVARLAARAPEDRAIVQHVSDWIVSGDFQAPFTLRLDPLAAVMILVVTLIGSIIHVYSIAYMREERDPEYARYFSYLNLFAAFMLVLVLASNFVAMFVGWEGVGLCSYLLIGFWYEKKSAADAGKEAFIVNRVGDVGFLLGIFLVFVHFGTVEFGEIARQLSGVDPERSFGAISAMTLLLFVGATGKSAQIPLHVWLPDAMEGPTPVSALIHAATMVTAGVYMIGRNAVLFSHAPETLMIVATIGAATALMAGTIGLVQNDIKRVLAYSTISQLGYMFLAMGVGAFASGIFHLFTHAFFKALLFLGAGALIHALGGEQDIRRMGGLKQSLPITYWTFFVGAVAIAGVPGLAGFFSKDEILYRTFASGHVVLWSIGLVTSLLTAVYMFRVVFLAFHGKQVPLTQPHGSRPSETPSGSPALSAGSAVHEAPMTMAVPLIILAAGSAVAGYAGLPRVLGGSDRFGRFLEPSFGERSVGTMVGAEAAGAEHLEGVLMVVSVVAAMAGIAIAIGFFLKNRAAADRMAERFPGVYRLLAHKYYVDEIYDAALVQPIRIASEEALWKTVDVRLIDGSVNGVGGVVSGWSALLRRLQTGSVRGYAASLLAGVVLILGYYLWR